MNYMGCVDNVGNTIQEADGVPPPRSFFSNSGGSLFILEYILEHSCVLCFSSSSLIVWCTTYIYKGYVNNRVSSIQGGEGVPPPLKVDFCYNLLSFAFYMGNYSGTHMCYVFINFSSK